MESIDEKIQQLNEIEKTYSDWDGECFGLNTVHDLIDVGELPDKGSDLYDALRGAIEATIAKSLGDALESGEYASENDVWSAYTNEYIKPDFSQIEEIINGRQ